MFWLCYWSGRTQVQSEPHLLAIGRVGCDTRDGLAVGQSRLDWLWWRSVVFPETDGLPLISTREVVQEATDGSSCYVIMVQPEKRSAVDLVKSIPVVGEYADVFPDEVLGLPPSRDVDFTIDLVPGPVSMAPYRMAPAELAELKKQIEDLLEKKFIRLSASPWGAQCY